MGAKTSADSTTVVTDSTTTERNRAVVEVHHTFSLLLSVPGRQTVEQTKRLLGLLVHGHIVSKFAALLSEGAGSIVNPLVTIDLLTAAGTGRCGDGGRAGENHGTGGGVRSGGNDVVDAVLLLTCRLLAHADWYTGKDEWSYYAGVKEMGKV